MNRVVVDCPDAESVARLAAKEFVRRATTAIRERDVFRVALAGGSTPKRMYELLAEPGLSRQLDWGSVHIFFGDERAVGPDDDQSNFKTAHVGLLSHVNVPTGQIHRMV
ncbi:MAG: 6-phosphogluconolactonase, partial [Vicinamibacteria bacterium]